ncbi:hypothetical protein Tco_0692280 [Tanacetum coccineum]
MSKVQISKVQISKVQISKVQISKVQISKVQISKVQISKVLHWDETHTFVPMDLEDKEKGTAKKSGGTRKKTLTRKSAELRSWLKVAQDDEESMNPKILYTKYPIVDWEYQLLGQVGGKDFEVYKLTRADGSASYYGNIQAFLRRLDREYLSTLYRLVQERFQDHPLKGYQYASGEEVPSDKGFAGEDAKLTEVIKNGNKVLRRTIGTVEQVYEPTTAEEKQDRRNEMKAKATLLMALPNNDQLKFHSYQDAKLLIEAIEKRLQKLISQLEIQREVIYQEDMNLKLLRSLPSKWKTHALIWRNKVEIETISIDVLYNNLKIYEPEITDNTAYEVSTAHTQGNGVNSTSLDNLCDAVIYGIVRYDWSYQAEEEQPTNHALMAFTSSGSSSSSDSETVFEESINVLKLEVRLGDNALDEYKMKWEKEEKERDQLKQTLEKFQNSSKSLNDLLESQVIEKFKTGLGYSTATAVSPVVESFVNLSDKSGSDKGYHLVPPPLTGNFIPPKPNLTFMDEIVESENLDVTTVVTPCNDKTIENKGVSNTVESNAIRMNNTSAPIIED